jgi:TolB-like protein/Flp pilus assembly protein TadD
MGNDVHNRYSGGVPRPLAQSASPAARPASLYLLGGFDLRDATGCPIELRTRKSRLLLAHLAVAPGRPVPREHLAALLWADRQEGQARGSLRSALSDLRRALGAEALVVDRDGVALRPDVVPTDYGRLKAAATGGPVGSLDDVYRGEFLRGHDYDGEAFTEWLRAVRSECLDLAIRAYEAGSARLAAEGGHAAAIDVMRRCLALEPLKESSHRALMRLHAASGERAMALAQYRACREVLRHELGAEPDPETVALADRIAMDDSASIATLRSAAAELHDRPRPRHDPADVPSIAVLPFVNLSGDAEQTYFAEGITEDIVTDLSGITGLSVAASGASGLYRGGTLPPDRIAAELGVRYLLEGSVRRFGEALRITARLADGPSNRQIWAERFDRRLANVFELQSEIAAAIVHALRLSLAPGATPLTHRATRDVEAYEAYLRARTLLREMTRRSIELARDGFARAVALDPGYAQAYAGLAESGAHLSWHHGADALAEAVAHADTAVRLDPNLAEAYCARGFAAAVSVSRRSEPAEADFATAIRLDPTLAVAHCYLGNSRFVTGDAAGAVGPLRRAFELADQDLQIGMMLNLCLRALGQREEGEAVCRHLVAVCRRRIAVDIHDERAAYVMAFAFHGLGEEALALRWAHVAAAFEPEDPRASYNIACLHAVLGEAETALAMLRRTLALGVSPQKVSWMRHHDPDLDGLRSDPRFEAVFAS